jgi:hypothetical protein
MLDDKGRVRCPRCKALALEESRNYNDFTFRCSSEECEALFFMKNDKGSPQPFQPGEKRKLTY